MHNQEWFDSLVPGDNVVIHFTNPGAAPYRSGKVEKITKTKIMVISNNKQGYTFSRDGQGKRAGRWDSPYFLEDPNSAMVITYKKKIAIRSMSKRLIEYLQTGVIEFLADNPLNDTIEERVRRWSDEIKGDQNGSV